MSLANVDHANTHLFLHANDRVSFQGLLPDPLSRRLSSHQRRRLLFSLFAAIFLLALAAMFQFKLSLHLLKLKLLKFMFVLKEPFVVILKNIDSEFITLKKWRIHHTL